KNIEASGSGRPGPESGLTTAASLPYHSQTLLTSSVPRISTASQSTILNLPANQVGLNEYVGQLTCALNGMHRWKHIVFASTYFHPELPRYQPVVGTPRLSGP